MKHVSKPEETSFNFNFGLVFLLPRKKQNVVHRVNSSILTVACAVRVDMDSINRMKAHLHACFAAWAKQPDRLKQRHVMSVAMNAHLVNSWAAMDVANHANVAHTDRKAFNQHALHVRWAEQHQKWVLHQLKNVRCPSANPAPISMER